MAPILFGKRFRSGWDWNGCVKPKWWKLNHDRQRFPLSSEEVSAPPSPDAQSLVDLSELDSDKIYPKEDNPCDFTVLPPRRLKDAVGIEQQASSKDFSTPNRIFWTQ